MTSRPSRRQFLALVGATAIPVTLLLGVPVARAQAPKVSPDDPTAKTLAYVHETGVAGQQCNNCALWQGGDAQWGGCPLFAGKSVSAKGWCKSWVKRG
jgi:anaerobic selenocysteine-containing dehydrogenase